MQCLTANIKLTTQVLTELSKVLPVLANRRVDGQIDFFVSGDLRWGIELLINENRRKAHRDRCSAGGNYADLNCNAFIVVDLLRPDPTMGPSSEQQQKVENSNNDLLVLRKEFSNSNCLL